MEAPLSLLIPTHEIPPSFLPYPGPRLLSEEVLEPKSSLDLLAVNQLFASATGRWDLEGQGSQVFFVLWPGAHDPVGLAFPMLHRGKGKLSE